MEARDSLPGQLDSLVSLARVPSQDRRARRLGALIESSMRAYAAPLRANGLVMTRADVLAESALGKRKVDRIRAEFATFNAAQDRDGR